MSTSLTDARPKSSLGLACLIAAGLLWGTGGFTGSLLNKATGLSPLAIATYRLLIGGALILIPLIATGRLPKGRAAWQRIVTVGALAALYQACYFAAVSLSSVSLATLITLGACPAAVLLGERLLGRRRLTTRTLLILALAAIGLALVVGVPSGTLNPAAVLASAGLALLAACGFAVLTLIGATPVPGLDDLTTTGFGFTIGGAILSLAAVSFSSLEFAPEPAAIALLLALGLIPTAIAYPLYFRGLRTVAAGTAAIMALLEPLTGAILGAAFLGDRLGIPAIAGGILLALAVILTARDFRR